MGYLQDHPTNWNWVPYVRTRVRRVLNNHPNVSANTYFDHPPDFHQPRWWPVDFYSAKSADFWGPGGRGAPIAKDVGRRVHHVLFWEPGPPIDWIIWNGRMWWNPATGGPGWTDAPWGPPDSDPGHYQHIHCTWR